MITVTDYNTDVVTAFLVILQVPLYREIALWLRMVDVRLESCQYILTQMGPGCSIAITPGGAAELLDSCLKDYILTLERRTQFVKLALETGYVTFFSDIDDNFSHIHGKLCKVFIVGYLASTVNYKNIGVLGCCSVVRWSWC